MNENTNDAKENMVDLEVHGNPDLWVLINKAESKSSGMMKSTKAMQTDSGVFLQVTTRQGDMIAESVTFAPGCKIDSSGDLPVIK